MNRQEFAHLLSQTQSMMAPSRVPTPAHLASDSCRHDPASAASPPLSPRQKFQAHVRTLSDQTAGPPRNASPTPTRSPELQHVSSLRVSYRQSSSPRSPSRSSPTWGNNESTLKAFNTTHNEPYFIREEREAWSRPSPTRTTMPFTDDVLFLQPPAPPSPILQPSKQLRELRPFAPLAYPVDVNERPKTSRGPAHKNANFILEHSGSNSTEEEDLPSRSSKFAEGSMNARSAGISSTWQEHSSFTSCSETESDDDATPRASPQRSSIDLNEFKPGTSIAPTFKQRLFKFGTKAKSKESTSKAEGEAAAKKKNGLRKSMSLWNLHGDRKKTAEGSESPEKQSAASGHISDLELLNDRKRRAEEAYAQQFGMKRRKSNVGLATATTGDHVSEVVATTRNQSQSRPLPDKNRRPSQSPSKTVAADPEWSDSHNDLDHQKRPTRRELEKENQQLRALLRQKQQEKTAQPASSSFRQHTLAPEVHEDDVSTAQPSAKKQSQKQPGAVAPPVPPIPERAALRTLSNTANQPHVKNKGHGSLVVLSASDVNDQPKHNLKKQRRRSSIVRGEGFSHPFSAILEEDEETGTAQARKENQCPKSDAELSQMKSGNGVVNIGGLKGKDHVATIQLKGVQRENWEWPDDVF